MPFFLTNIERETLSNTNFRRVLYTTKRSQLVLMSLKPGEEIGEETHDLDQFLRIEAGSGLVVIEGVEHPIKDDDAIVIPAGTKHNVVNDGAEDLKLYSIYSPPEHKDGVVHRTKAEADAAEEHFDGATSAERFTP